MQSLAFSSNKSLKAPPIWMTHNFHLVKFCKRQEKAHKSNVAFFTRSHFLFYFLSLLCFLFCSSYYSLCTASKKFPSQKGEKKETWDDKHANWRKKVEKIFSFSYHSGAKFAKFYQNSIIKGAKMENVVKLWQNYVFKIISPLVFVLAFLLFLDISRVHCGFRFWYWLFYGNKSKQLAIFSSKNLSRS